MKGVNNLDERETLKGWKRWNDFPLETLFLKYVSSLKNRDSQGASFWSDDSTKYFRAGSITVTCNLVTNYFV